MNPENNQQQQNPAPSNPQAALPPKHNTFMAVLSYIGPLVLVPYFTSKEDSFVRFHIKQGLVLLTLEIALWIVSSIFFILMPIWWIIHLLLVVWSIIGIVHVVQGKEKTLPLVGKYGDRFKI